MLKKSGISKGNTMNYLAFIVRIVHVCVDKQSAVKPRDAIGRKEEEPALIVVSPTNSPTPQNIFSYFEVIPVCLFDFRKFKFTYFSHNYHDFSMFRDVPRCSGMFHVPDFIDGHLQCLIFRIFFATEHCHCYV